jgi:FAD/FMN-containing dehydrogenase
MGLTGVILQARLKLIPIETSFISVDYQQAPNLDAALAGFAAGDTKYQYSVAWIDCLSEGASMGRSVLIRGNHAAVKDLDDKKKLAPLALPRKRKQTVPFNFPNFALSPLSVSLFNKTFYARHGDSHQLVDYDTFFYPLDSVLHWNRIYGKHGFFQYQAVFPTKDASGGLTELLKQITASGQASFLCVLKSMGKSSGGLLSFPVPGQTLALDIKNNGASTTALLRQLDEIVLKHGGRVYLAKDACLAPQTFAAMYPQLTEFNRIKAELDPTGRFGSSLARRLKIGAGQ